MVETFTGAWPVTYARLLLTVTAGFTEKPAAFTAASWAAMLLCACTSHGSMLAAGFSTLRPLATKVLYLAASTGPLLATFKGPLTSSPKARRSEEHTSEL